MTDQAIEQMLALDAAPGPALAIDDASSAALIDAALAGAGFGPAGGGGGGGSASAAGTTKLAIALGAALIVAAIALFAWRSRRDESEQVAAVIPDAAVDASAGSGTGTPPVDAEVAVPPPVIERGAPEPARPAPRPEPAEPAADLLGAANAKRAAKQWRESDALYARVVDRAPRSLAAQTALIASASLHLEHLSDPRGAAKRFRRALAIAPRGALAEDARWGIVEAARATRDTAAEAAALDDFLAHHPGSPLAAQAKARRAELP